MYCHRIFSDNFFILHGRQIKHYTIINSTFPTILNTTTNNITINATPKPKEILGLSVVKKVIKNQLTKVAVNCK